MIEPDYRLEKSGNRNYDELSTGLVLPLNKGDLLIFSANMIHRGLYGKNRRALDVLLCEAQDDLIQFVDTDCLPDQGELQRLENPVIFQNTINIKSKVSVTIT